MKRGDVYLTNLNPVVGSEQAGTRPTVVVSRDAINASSPVVIIVPVTDRANKKHLYPSHVELKMGDANLTCDSVAVCEQVRAIARSRLVKSIGHLSTQKMSQINGSLKLALDLP